MPTNIEENIADKQEPKKLKEPKEKKVPKPKKPKISESALMESIRDKLEFRKNITMFRNNTGIAAAYDFYKKSLRRPLQIIRYGLINGSSDLIGYKVVEVTQEMVDQKQKLAVFTAIEVKTEKGIVSDEQKEFLRKLKKSGGIAIVARSLQDVKEIL